MTQQRDVSKILKSAGTVANLHVEEEVKNGGKNNPKSTLRRAWQEASIGDCIAGITVAVTSLPQYIAYAELAGLHGHQGIQASAPPLVVFSAVTTSPCLSLGVTSITALMAHANLRGAEYREANGDAAWVELLGAYSMLAGVMSILLAALGATKLTSYIPGPVKAGWKLGFAFAVLCSQTAGALFGKGANQAKSLCALPKWPAADASAATPISGGTAATYRLAWMLTHPHLWDLATASLAILTIAMVTYGSGILTSMLRAVTRRPGARAMPGLEVIIATVVCSLLAAQFGYVGSLVGKPPVPEQSADSDSSGGAAAIMLSWVNRWPWEMPWAELATRLGGWPRAIFSAAAFAAVDFLAIISVQAETPPAWGWSPARELAGQGIGCIASGMAGSAPVGGSLSRSMVAKMTGAASPLTGLVCGLATAALSHPLVSGALAVIPKAILAAVVITAVLPAILRPKDLLRLKGMDAATGWVTAVGSAFTDPTTGFGMGLAFAGVVAIFRMTFKKGSKVSVKTD